MAKNNTLPCQLYEVNAFVKQHHHHHQPVRVIISAWQADHNGKVRGVAIVGRPVSQVIDDGWTLEVTRVATDDCSNVCSVLYAVALRAARAIGYWRLVTYTLSTESGISLQRQQALTRQPN